MSHWVLWHWLLWHWLLWHWVFWHWVLGHWVLCPHTHLLVFVLFKNTSVLGLGYFQYQAFCKNTFRIPLKVQLSSVH